MIPTYNFYAFLATGSCLRMDHVIVIDECRSLLFKTIQCQLNRFILMGKNMWIYYVCYTGVNVWLMYAHCYFDGD